MVDIKGIQSLEVIRWKTLDSVSFERFQRLIMDEGNRDIFDEDFAEKIGDRLRELERFGLRTSALLLAIILFMGAINTEMINEINILGVKISKHNSSLDVLVLMTSILFFLTSITNLIGSYYTNLLNSIIKSKFDKDVTEYYMSKFSWSFGNIFGKIRNQNQYIKPKFLVILIIATWATSITVAAVVIYVLQIFIFSSSILSIYTDTRDYDIIGIPIIVVALCALVFHIGSLVIQLPLPMVDRENVKILTDLEESDPEKAREIRASIAKRNLETEKRNIPRLQIIAFLTITLFLHISFLGDGFFTDLSAWIQITLSLLIFVAAISPLLNKYEDKMILRLGTIQNERLKVKRYVNGKRRMLIIRLLISIAYGVISFGYFRGNEIDKAIVF
ncbi:MAG: hypothetical protein OXN81_20850 [Alphaproteobacteria bacterium]|nr:hypothetical protein [Alphaproteobacteria bacterium]